MNKRITFEMISNLVKKADQNKLDEALHFINSAYVIDFDKLQSREAKISKVLEILPKAYEEYDKDETNNILHFIFESPIQEETIIKELSDTISVIGSEPSVKNMTLEDIQNLDITDMHIYRDSARYEREKAEDERKNEKNKPL